MPDIAQILDAIDQRLADANEEIDSLSAARSILAGDHAPRTRRGSGRRRGRPRRGEEVPAAAAPASSPAPTPVPAPPPTPAATAAPAAGESVAAVESTAGKTGRAGRAPRATSRRSRRSEERPEQTIEALLGETPDGMSAVALSKRAGMGYARVLTRLHQLEAAGTVLSTGTKRTSLWRLVTDEDRIAKRVAELERAAGRS